MPPKRIHRASIDATTASLYFNDTSSEVVLEESPFQKHARMVSQLSKFDLQDIGTRADLPFPPDLVGIKHVLVTGGAGFIGCFLARKLVVLYPELHIHVLDKLDYCGSLNNLKCLRGFPNFSFIKGDITSSDFMSFLLKERHIDVIFHLAAQTHVDNSFGDSFNFTVNNVMGTHVLLEAAKVNKVKRFVHVSTDEVYGEVEHSRPDVSESTILAPSNPYSATKAAAECLVKAYFKSFSVPIIITRSNNVYGPYQYPEKIMSKFICSLIKDKPCFIHGDGSNSRKYLYAADVANALCLILHSGTPGESYNIGSAFEISNLDLAKYLFEFFQLGEDHIQFVEDRAFNDLRYAVDCSKLERLGWRPKMTFSDGIKKTIEWYRENCDTWWGNISPALVAHPLKALPSFEYFGL